MLIKTLRMENFRQFKGTTSVSFSVDPKQNVTVILGDNTFGKTTLLQAFNWCFYGVAKFDHNPDMLLNLEIASEMREGDKRIVEVEITVIHQDVEYVISRTQNYFFERGKAVGEREALPKVSYKQENGEMEAIKASQVKNMINTILPEDLSTYFFFDTERVSSISTRKDVAEAVKGLLGLAPIDNAVHHLGDRTKKTSVIGRLYGSMDLDGDSRAQDALNRIRIAREKRDAISAQIEECNSQINSYEAKKDQLETILRDNEESARLQHEKEKLEKLLIAEKANLEEKIALFFKEFSNGALAFFSQSLVRRTSEFLKEVKVDDKGVVDLTAPTILELLRRGRCICGAEITEGNDAYQHLKEELAYVPPENIGNTVRHYRDKLSGFSRSADTTYDSIANRYAEIHRLMDRIQDMEDDLQRISESIKDTENMAQYEADLLDTKKRLRELNAKKERLIRDDGSYKQTIDSCQKLYDSLVAVSGKNKQIMELISYAESVREWFATTYKEKEHDIREQLEDKVNAIFERMYHGHRRVAIDMRYQVSLLTTIADKEVAAGESEGSNRVKNFAFIAGLVALAKEKIIADSGEAGIPIPTEPYPLVMDAPFSNADETHTANISKVLPEVAEQVIMFVMQKDWNYAQPVMASKIGATYHLQKQSETYTVLN
ncbi:MAG: AAA family ATPase [Oscillospiraceae bacterium]|nr:AAA family ATPase [Oscillospiraceae bacterium]OLA68261.1 MAG: DNA sulfur modification protein DndD [Ruminococcus sp. 37_24]